MKQNRLAATGAAAVIAAGLSLVAVGAANAEPAAKPGRVASADLQASLQQAVALHASKGRTS